MSDIAEEYRSSLEELNSNSKPHINMLTILAEENINYADIIVKTIVDHINSVPPDSKLPSLYLVDSIVKNIGKIYSSLFSKHIINVFTSVFNQVPEVIRSLLYKLRLTWTDIFSKSVLLELDTSINYLDPAWPIAQHPHKNIHVNPKFLDKSCVEKKGKDRDPRLANKKPPATINDGATLQSVVAVPKGNFKRRIQKCPLSPASKKIKLDDGLEPPPRPPMCLETEDKDYLIHKKILHERNLNDATYRKFGYSSNNGANKNNFPYKRNMHTTAYPRHPQANGWSETKNSHQYKRSFNCFNYAKSEHTYNDVNKFHLSISTGLTLPPVKSFKLDNKKRKVFFVNERSFALLEDDIPRELLFEGPPQLVFIEGLPQPIELGFAGCEARFEVDGQFHFIKFGTPAREIYIDNYPYEASFNGLPFTAKLENGKVCRIKISGPAPKVVLSAIPAYDLYNTFCQNNREFLERFDNEPYVNHNYSTEVPVANHDVDMRVNNSEFSSTFNFPLEKMNDVNWQRMHVGNSQQTEWTVPKNSFETCKDVNPIFIAHRNYSEGHDWNKSLPLSQVENPSLNMATPLPPKPMINRFPPSTTFGPNCSTVNTHLQRFSRSVPSNNGPFPQRNSSGGDFLVCPQFNEAPSIPKLSPPPVPPFLNTIPSTSCMTSLSITKDLVQTSVPYCSSTVPATLSQTAATVPLQATASTKSTALGTGSVNIDLLLEQLVAGGFIGEKSENSASSPAPTDPTYSDSKNESDNKEEPSKEDCVPEIIFESKSLKEYYPAVIEALHNGSQCATCGMRFKDSQKEQYRLHLDWHFRRIHREKVGAKNSFSRKLFYEVQIQQHNLRVNLWFTMAQEPTSKTSLTSISSKTSFRIIS